MGANPTQAVGITLFLIAFVLLAGATGGQRRDLPCRRGISRPAGNLDRRVLEGETVGEPEGVTHPDCKIFN